LPFCDKADDYLATSQNMSFPIGNDHFFDILTLQASWLDQNQTKTSQIAAFWQEAQFWNVWDSGLALGVPIKVLDPISEAIWYFRRKKSTRVTDFIGD
jgi:hypothetical protein